LTSRTDWFFFMGTFSKHHFTAFKTCFSAKILPICT